jgi:regulator of protease activity HflC (stomatin/prohibitin superfamily)
MIDSSLPSLLLGGLAIVVIYFLSTLFRSTFARHIIWEYEKGIKYKSGRFDRVLEPGSYLIFKRSSKITALDMRPRHLVVSGQELLSSDGIGLKVSLAGQWLVADPLRAINSTENYVLAIYSTAQIGLREIVGANPIDDLLQNRASIDLALFEKCEKKVEEYGLRLISINIRDIMFPGELKKVFAQVIRARKEGLAALERARGETAALRNLANTAKLVESNPMLLQLRALQLLGESSGNTLVLGVPLSETAVAGKGAGPRPEPEKTEESN